MQVLATAMNDALEDEILSINAIYELETLSHGDASNEYILRLPGSDTTLRLAFPDSYPETAPEILGSASTGLHAKKGTANQIVALAQDVLAQCFRPGEPCIFELLEQLAPLLPQELKEASHHEPKDEMMNKEEIDVEPLQQPSKGLGVNPYLSPEWALSEVITEKKSIFLGRAARVSHPDEAKEYIRHLLSTDKKVAKATHNITAWRISVPNERDSIVYQDCDDDGEDAAGGRVLSLLQTMDVWNVVVVVSRFFGGTLLGPSRFKFISNAARDALLKGGFDKPAGSKQSRKV